MLPMMVHSQGKQVARHERSYLVKQEVLSLEHYLNVPNTSPARWRTEQALVQYRQSGLWPQSFDVFWEKLMEAKEEAKAHVR